MTQRALSCDLTRTVLLFLEDLNTPFSLRISLLIRNNEWDQLAESSVKPGCYLDYEGERFFRDTLAASLLKKMNGLPCSFDKRARALKKWWNGEHSCKKTNFRLEPYLASSLFPEEREKAIFSLIGEIRKEVLMLVGPKPPDLLSGRFGPGATYNDRGQNATIPDKMSTDPSLTPGSVWYLPQWLDTKWATALVARQGELSFVRGNRYLTVPKTSLIDRSIAVEPSVNVFFQLSLGRVIRERLRSRGWDLDRAQEIHRQTACASSVSREYCTLDLSNASDTVSTNLVKLLMPRQWFEALESLRSPFTLVDGKWVKLEKFSSMGNGYTFELETLIFAAISLVVSRKAGYAGKLGDDVFCFGDDIIVKDSVYEPLESVLRWFGFEINQEKSFHGSSPFRESCGGDYWLGREVRPFSLKQSPSTPEQYISFANGLTANLDRLSAFGAIVGRRSWLSVLDLLPHRIRQCRGPKSLGDIVIHDEFPRWKIRVKWSIRYLQVYRPARFFVKRYDRYSPEVVLASALYGCGNRQGGVVPRDGVRGYSLAWVPFS